MKSIRIFGKSIPIWTIAILLAVAVAMAATFISIGTVNMPWEIVQPPPPPPEASMRPSEITLNIGTLYIGQSKTVEPINVADLTVKHGNVTLNFTLGGRYDGFTEMTIVVQLRHGNNVEYKTTIDLLNTSAIIKDVRPGNYDVYIGFSVTAGNVPKSGVAVLTVAYAPS